MKVGKENFADQKKRKKNYIYIYIYIYIYRERERAFHFITYSEKKMTSVFQENHFIIVLIDQIM